MRVQIATGRTHQIRVHAAESGHPIVGDSKYGDREFNRTMAEFGVKRLFLHAQGLQIHQDVLGRGYEFLAKLPEDLRHCIKKLDAA
jgi:23S rRNA pseudouridine955/2504/2580 synthase